MKTKLAGIGVGTGHPVRIMGVINVSPESFFKGSIKTKRSAIAGAARKLESEGADFIDVGAMSTAPYLKTKISIQEETLRLVEAVQIIGKNSKLPISIDTSRAKPAAAGLKAGAKILNDIYGFRRDSHIAEVAKKAEGIILMAHPFGTREKNLSHPIQDAKRILNQSIKIATQHRIPKSRIVLDPGIGFFRKTKQPWWQWDSYIIRMLSQFTSLRCPVLVGLSRKSFIGHLLEGAPPENRLAASLAATLVAVRNGAAIIRTHDVAQTRKALSLV